MSVRSEMLALIERDTNVFEKPEKKSNTDLKKTWNSMVAAIEAFKAKPDNSRWRRLTKRLNHMGDVIQGKTLKLSFRNRRRLKV